MDNKTTIVNTSGTVLEINWEIHAMLVENLILILYLLLLHFDGEYTICDYGCAKVTVVWDESSSNDKLKKSITYVINNKYCVLHCVLSARLWIDTCIYHGTSLLKLAHVQLVFNCNEWLLQEVQGEVSQLKLTLLFIIVVCVQYSVCICMR